MKDHIFVGEFRKRVSVLERKYEALKRDLDAARIALAMFERESEHNFQAAGNLSQAEIIADIVIDALSHNKEMHRGDILDAVVLKGVYVGYDDDQKKQLAALSTLLSKDARFRPVKGKNGFWTLARPDSELPSPAENTGKIFSGTEVVESRPDGAENGLPASAVVTPSGVFRRYKDISSSIHTEETA